MVKKRGIYHSIDAFPTFHNYRDECPYDTTVISSVSQYSISGWGNIINLHFQDFTFITAPTIGSNYYFPIKTLPKSCETVYNVSILYRLKSNNAESMVDCGVAYVQGNNTNLALRFYKNPTSSSTMPKGLYCVTLNYITTNPTK